MVFQKYYLATSAPRQSSQRHSNPNPQNFPSQRSDSRPNSLPGKNFFIEINHFLTEIKKNTFRR